MTIIRTPTIDRVVSVSLQSAQGTPATPVTGDITTFVKFDVDPNIENILRADVGLGRSHFGYTAPGKQSAKWSAEVYALLANAAAPVVAPLCDNLLFGALGATPVSFNDTVQASPSPTASTFAFTSAASLKVGDPIAVNIGGSTGWQMRPISAIATNTCTFSPPFSAAPSSGAVACSRIYRLSSASPNFFTMVDWVRDQTLVSSALSSMAVDAVVSDLSIDCSQTIVSLTAGGPASYVVRQQDPALPPFYNGTFPTLPTLPTNIVSGYNPETPYLNGEAFFGTTQVTPYSVKVTLSNGAKQLPVPFGSQVADGVLFGVREVKMDMTMDGNSANYLYLQYAQNKTAQTLFFHTGQTQGQFIGFYSPKMNLGLNPIEENDISVRLNFTNSAMFAGLGADTELTIGIC